MDSSRSHETIQFVDTTQESPPAASTSHPPEPPASAHRLGGDSTLTIAGPGSSLQSYCEY